MEYYSSVTPTPTAKPTPTPTPSLPDFLRFSDTEGLPHTVEKEDDTFFGPISVSEENGFIFVEEHREIFVRKNYNTSGRLHIYYICIMKRELLPCITKKITNEWTWVAPKQNTIKSLGQTKGD